MPDEKTGGAAHCGRILRVFEKHQQLFHRHAPSFIRHVLDAFHGRTLSAADAAGQLGLSSSRLYALSARHLRARTQKKAVTGFRASLAATTRLPGPNRSWT